LTADRSPGSQAKASVAAFSRKQECEANTYATRPFRAAGYEAGAMGWFLARMGEWDRLDAVIAGRRQGNDQLCWFSIHSCTPNPVRAAVAAAGGSQAGESAREAHVRRINGLIWGDDVDEAVIRGHTFIHPTLRVRFEVPQAVRLVNCARAATATHSPGGPILFDAGQIRGDAPPDHSLPRGWATHARLTGLQTLEVGGLQAAARTRLNIALGPMDHGCDPLRPRPLLAFPVRRNPAAQRSSLASRPRAARCASSPSWKPRRSRCCDRGPTQARRGETVAALARSMPLFRAEAQFRPMNGLCPDEQVQPGQWLQLIAE
jgi:predicted Zn-dependent protease